MSICFASKHIYIVGICFLTIFDALCRYTSLVYIAASNFARLFVIEPLVQNKHKLETACCRKEGFKKIHKLVADLIILYTTVRKIADFEVIEQIKPHRHLHS